MNISEHLSHVRAEVLHDLESNIKTIPMVRAWFNDLDTTVKCYTACLKLNEYWRLPYPRLIRFANGVDLPFVKLCAYLSAAGINYDMEYFIAEWRKLKAINQHHIISYIRLHTIQNKVLHHASDHIIYDTITWHEVLCHSELGKEFINQLEQTINDDRALEFRLREILGCSMQADIKEAWHRWIKTNHPDKGGDHNKFILASASYEEWQRRST